MVRIDQCTGGAGGLALFRLFCSNPCTLAGDPGNDRHGAVDRLDIGADKSETLLLGKESAFAGMTENDEAFDPFHRNQPFGDFSIGLVINFAVAGEGGNGGRA